MGERKSGYIDSKKWNPISRRRWDHGTLVQIKAQQVLPAGLRLVPTNNSVIYKFRLWEDVRTIKRIFERHLTRLANMK